MNSADVVSKVEKNIGYVFINKDLCLEALTHSSFSNEMRINRRNCYERLEFLGDAVLELVSSEFLFKEYPTFPEGELSKRRAALVCEPSLAKCARAMNLKDSIFLGKGEEATGGRENDSILADVTEALLGAIYLDGGIEFARKYTYSNILDRLNGEELFVDNKTALQELLQKNFEGEAPVYEMVSESGPDHNKSFVVSVSFQGKVLATGEGHSKKSAQQNAAKAAIDIIKRG